MNLILDILFPKTCGGCNSWGSYFCDKCQLKTDQSALVCPICEKASIGGVTHKSCLRKYSLDGLWFLGDYKDPLKKVIQKLKYKFVSEVGECLVEFTLNYWARYSPWFFEEIKQDPYSWIITSVPLHPKRQRWRGFNQSEKLAVLISKRLGLDYIPTLKRTRFTKPQMSLLAKDRALNIKGAFELNPSVDIRNKNILIIDDVWTTGSTIKECGLVLKRNNAKKVWAITIAR